MPDHSNAQAPSAAAPDQPVRSADRLVSLDFIRGVAVLGILLANITAFAHPVLAYQWPPALPGGGNTFDRVAWLIQFVLVDGKFRGLFTILLGAGMYLFLERAWARGEGTGLQARRLFFLLLFGALHSVLLFAGDILVLYALAGFLALPLVGWSARRQLAWGLAGYLLGSSLTLLALATPMTVEQWPATSADVAPLTAGSLEHHVNTLLHEADRERAIMAEGSFAEVVRYRTAEEIEQASYLVWLALTETLPLMLLGMAAYRMGLFSNAADPRKVRLWGWIALGTGVIATLSVGLWPYLAGFPLYLTSFVANGVGALTSLPTLLGLAALLALASARATRGWLGPRVIAAGRMAFSNYVGTSMLMMLVFQGWGGGLFGVLHRGELLLVVAAGWAAMLAWSKPWLAHFRYGPLEWVWRCLTYGKLFALRR